MKRGDGTPQDSPTPLAVAGLGTVALVVVGDSPVCVDDADGAVRCWGSHGNGQMGHGTPQVPLTPVDPGVVTAASARGSLTEW